MFGAISWGALSICSFALFIAFPSGPSGFNYAVLVPAFLSLTAATLMATQLRDRSTRKLAEWTPSAYDHTVATKTEKLKQDKEEEQARMLRTQSSRRRAARH